MLFRGPRRWLVQGPGRRLCPGVRVISLSTRAVGSAPLGVARARRLASECWAMPSLCFSWAFWSFPYDSCHFL